MRGRIQIDARLVAAGLLAGATALTVLLITSPPQTTEVLVAGSALPAGVRLADLDVAVRSVANSAGVVEAVRRGDLFDHVLAAPLSGGSPIPESLLVAPAGARQSDLLGVDLEGAAAVQGAIEAGDVVDVYSVSADAELVATDVPVVMVRIDRGAIGVDRVHLLLAVQPEMTRELVAASSAGAVYLVRSGS